MGDWREGPAREAAEGGDGAEEVPGDDEDVHHCCFIVIAIDPAAVERFQKAKLLRCRNHNKNWFSSLYRCRNHSLIHYNSTQSEREEFVRSSCHPFNHLGKCICFCLIYRTTKDLYYTFSSFGHEEVN